METMKKMSPEITLEQCFKEIIVGKPLSVDIATLNNILYKSLGINLNYLKPRVKYILPYMLVHFITSWPGWKKTVHYQKKEITFDNWFRRFKEYLIFKINFMIKNEYDKALAMLKHNSSEFENNVVQTIDSSTQTNPNIDKVTAPFSIEIFGPPKVLNSLVFCEGPNDSVVVREYKVNTLWERPLNIRQLINWPFIEVEFKSKHLHFKRTNQHEFKRCLTFSSEKILYKKSDNCIEDISIINNEIPRLAYTLNALKEYCNSYITFLRSQKQPNEDIQEEIEIILENFILDIVDINKNSMATNTTVFFNIGNAIYARNKSIKTSKQAICFSECLTPKLTLSLYSFTGIQDQQIVSFDDSYSFPTIGFWCTFCKQLYLKYSELWKHLQNAHIMEQPVLCFKCKRQFKIGDLCLNRWVHDCRLPPQDNPPIEVVD